VVLAPVSFGVAVRVPCCGVRACAARVLGIVAVYGFLLRSASVAVLSCGGVPLLLRLRELSLDFFKGLLPDLVIGCVRGPQNRPRFWEGNQR
jgi:hypothetical protein